MEERVPPHSKEDLPTFLELQNPKQVSITLRIEAIRNCLSRGRSAGGIAEDTKEWRLDGSTKLKVSKDEGKDHEFKTQSV